jgi:hypothetical protein
LKASTRFPADRGVDVYVYFKHEDDPAGIEYARILLRRFVVGWQAP